MTLEGDAIAHHTFSELPRLLRPDDLLILNETRVIAARLIGEREGGGEAELLLLHPAHCLQYDPQALDWIALARPAKRLRPGDRIRFGENGTATIRARLDAGMRRIEFETALSFEEFLDRAGRMPIPPYIHNESAQAQERYQTVFARVPGSIAAPTASLHFTPRLLARIEHAGIEIARITLAVGLGTFRPVCVDSIEDHVMHEEAYGISPAAADAIDRARGSGRRIVAAGTTVVRALEGNFQAYQRIEPGEHTTGIFIVPGFRFCVVDAMITNFHLPRSTLLMLVAAFAGRERILRAYGEAVAQRYRFYSFGDAMLIERGKVVRCAT
jgi:S-adenosylmethionine:tRNA ribosyltransferase-isomerase